MRRRRAALIAAVFCGVLWAGRVEAVDLILRPRPNISAKTICARYGFTLTTALDKKHLYVVQAPDTVTQATLDTILANDRDVQNLEFSITVLTPPVPGGPALTQSIAAILEQYKKTFVNYYGTSAWDAYLTQSAAQQIHVAEAHAVATGAGTIAIIDTGVDPYHPALQNALVEGYDFTRDLQGFGSEWSDVAGLTQSIADILESYWTVTLSQSIADILEGGSVSPAPLPPYFGHGTMVAGIVHLAAPTSKIMPLKAFSADGSATLFNIIRAIYYATDRGARVINMSFAMRQPSKELLQALDYAAARGVVSIAAVGNNGLSTDTYPVYPADYKVTFGVGSTQGEQRSTFSNYGSDVTVGAPGEGLLTTYPGGLYAAVWGTSFSTGWTTGSVGLFLERNAQVKTGDVANALEKGATKLRSTEGMGEGRIDVYKSTLAVPVR